MYGHLVIHYCVIQFLCNANLWGIAAKYDRTGGCIRKGRLIDNIYTSPHLGTGGWQVTCYDGLGNVVANWLLDGY